MTAGQRSGSARASVVFKRRPGAPDGAVPAAAGRLWTRDFVMLTLANFAGFAAMQLLIPTLPLYVVQLGGSELAIGLVGGALLVTAVAVRPWVGQLLDRRGRQRVLLGSFALFAAAGLLYPFALSLPTLFAVRLLQGVGWGGSVPAAGTLAADLVPAERRGEGMGYFGLSTNLGTALAPAIGLAIARGVGFGPLFLTSVGCAALAALATLAVRDQHVRPVGAGTPAALFEPAALPPSVAVGLLSFMMGGVLTFLPVDAVRRSIGDPALFFVIYALVLLITRPTAGWLSDRRGRGVVLVPGIVFMGLAVWVLGATAAPWTLPAAAVSLGLGFGAAQPALQALVVDRVSPDRRGAANAAFYIAFDLGIGLGAILFGAVGGGLGLEATFRLASGLAVAALGVVVATRLYRA